MNNLFLINTKEMFPIQNILFEEKEIWPFHHGYIYDALKVLVTMFIQFKKK